MSDVWPLHGDGQRYENAGQLTASSTLTAVPIGGSNNTKGGWVQLIASSSFDTCGVLLQWAHVTNAVMYLVDVGVGAVASEQVVISNIPIGRTGFGHTVGYQQYFPISIPSASAVSVRGQVTNTASDTLLMAATLIGAGWTAGSPMGNSETWGAATTTSRGTAVTPGTSNAKGTYAQMTAASAKDVDEIILFILVNGGTAQTNQTFLLDIATGAAASETVLIPNLFFSNDADDDAPDLRQFGPLPINIPAGSRVAVRSQCSSVTANAHDVLIIGINR